MQKKPFIAGGYDIGGVVGIGTYGEVRYGRHLAKGTRVAIKIVDLSRFRDDTTRLIRKEIKILEMLRHKHVIGILEVKDRVPFSGQFCDSCACTQFKRLANGTCRNCTHSCSEHSMQETRPVLMIVQELAVGGEIFGLLMHCGALTEEVARLYFRQLIFGLEYLHSQGIVHRDLKPENLVLDASFDLKLVDFGLAAFIGDSSDGLLHSGVGSQPYSAPEVYYVKELFQSAGYDGPAADIWSCAVILFVMLNGRPPFVRPLLKTYGHTMKKDKHFVNLLQGIGFDRVSPAAKDLLQKLFRLDPSERITIEKIKQDPWFNGPTPRPDVLERLMEEKSRNVWKAQDKSEMCEILVEMREELVRGNQEIPEHPFFGNAGEVAPEQVVGSPSPSPPSASTPLDNAMYDDADKGRAASTGGDPSAPIRINRRHQSDVDEHPEHTAGGNGAVSIPRNKAVESPLVSSFGESFSPSPLPYFGRPVNFPSTPNSFAPFSTVPSSSLTPSSVTFFSTMKPIGESERMDLSADTTQRNGVTMSVIPPLTISVPAVAPKTGFMPVRSIAGTTKGSDRTESELAPKPAGGSLLAESLNSQRHPVNVGAKVLPSTNISSISLLSLTDTEAPVYRGVSFPDAEATTEDLPVLIRAASSIRPQPARVLLPTRLSTQHLSPTQSSAELNTPRGYSSEDEEGSCADTKPSRRPRKLRKGSKPRRSKRASVVKRILSHLPVTAVVSEITNWLFVHHLTYSVRQESPKVKIRVSGEWRGEKLGVGVSVSGGHCGFAIAEFAFKGPKAAESNNQSQFFSEISHALILS